MPITPQNLIALLPLLIVGLTVVVVMLSIAWRRNHFLNATLSVIGLNAALVSLLFVGQAGAMDVTPLMRVDGFAMLYTGLVLLASLATCTFAYPWLEGYKDNKEEFYLLVLIAALLVGGYLAWNALKPADNAGETPTASVVRYTIRFQKMIEGTGCLVEAGDELTETVKNYALGPVIDSQVVPNQTQSLDLESRRYINTSIEGYEDVVVTVEANATETDSAPICRVSTQPKSDATTILCLEIPRCIIAFQSRPPTKQP
mgnify:CR=1 FL=1